MRSPQTTMEVKTNRTKGYSENASYALKLDIYTMSVPKHRLLAWQMIPSGLIFHQQRYLLSDSQA
jgi:hypothetical protein